ncbi:serine hydrolase domain-containing protein [Actinosynnema sp. CS-041913]|uniref:serine hydrolase domain-containing protein n=1 Tax=Actinosynnema sp. CS-041913 TaxID=3239917 RepID=UPI003D8D346A
MKRIPVIVTALCVAVGLSTGVATAAPGSSPARTLQRDADAMLAQGVPGVLVELDTRRGDVKVRSGYGDVAAKTPVPWNARFRIGSFTKTFVATTVLQLVGEGRLSLEDSVERWLPGVVAGNGNDGRLITVRQLLQHTSGLHDYAVELPNLFKEKDFLRTRFDTYPPEELVRRGLSKPPNFPPGTDFSYSNTNYVLAGMLIERVTGRSWQDEVTARIIRPLGLRHTSTPNTSPFIPKPHAKGYDRFAEKGLEADPADPRFGPPVDVTMLNPSWGGSAGAMISTTEDGNKFLQALLGGKVLPPAELAEMKRTVPTPDDWSGPGVRYGLGILWSPNSCGGSWSHGGTIHGFLTRNGVTDDGKRSVMVSLNTRTPVPADGTPPPQKDFTVDLLDHALCGRS